MEYQLSLFDVPVQTVQKKTNWLVIDGNNLLNRCYYATANNPRGLLRAPDGRYTNAVSLFLKMMLNYEKSLQAKTVVMFDKGKSYRKEIYPAYKEGRNDTPEPLEEQFPLIQEILMKADIPIYMDTQYEADDFIASFAERATGHVYVLSNDRDVFQLISDKVTIIVRKGKEDVFMTPEQFNIDFEGLTPMQIVDLKALSGDSSDNIPGVKGIGEPGALKLLKEFGTLERMIDAEAFPQHLNRYKGKLQDGKEDAVFFKKLTTLHRDIPMDIRETELDKKELIKYCEILQIKSIRALLS